METPRRHYTPEQKVNIMREHLIERTLDGIHIATALKLGSPELVTADKKMADAAKLLGIKTKLLKELTSE